MSQLRITISKIIDTLVYIALSLLGLYFIYEGHILEKYRSRRTSYAEYDEEIIELEIEMADHEDDLLDDMPASTCWLATMHGRD